MERDVSAAVFAGGAAAWRKFRDETFAMRRLVLAAAGAVAWAPGAERYLQDCIELFDEQGWDWCYHAFNEWRGWNVEYEGGSRETLRRTGDTPRKKVLLDGFKGKAASNSHALRRQLGVPGESRDVSPAHGRRPSVER